jgi:hypothetical protein
VEQAEQQFAQAEPGQRRREAGLPLHQRALEIHATNTART